MGLTIENPRLDPYHVEPGPELDVLIHVRLMKLSVPAGQCPAYSTDKEPAKRALSRLRTGKASVIVGRTSITGRSWFARYERNAMDGTEVFANTFELAICRLALLRLEDIDVGT